MIKATISSYCDFSRESWKEEDGQLVWDDSMFDSQEESDEWKAKTIENGSLFA